MQLNNLAKSSDRQQSNFILIIPCAMLERPVLNHEVFPRGYSGSLVLLILLQSIHHPIQPLLLLRILGFQSSDLSSVSVRFILLLVVFDVLVAKLGIVGWALIVQPLQKVGPTESKA